MLYVADKIKGFAFLLMGLSLLLPGLQSEAQTPGTSFNCKISNAIEGEAQLTIFCEGSTYGFFIEDTRVFVAEQLATIANARRTRGIVTLTIDNNGRVRGIVPSDLAVAVAQGAIVTDPAISTPTVETIVEPPVQTFDMGAPIVYSTFTASAPPPTVRTSAGNLLSYKLAQGHVLFLQKKWSIDVSKILNIYSKRQFEPIWIKDGMFSLENYAVLEETLKMAELHGLNVADYLSPDVLTWLNLAGTEDQLMELEILLTDALVRYLSDLNTGRFSHRQIDTDLRFAPKKFSDWTALNTTINTSLATLHIYADSKAPQQPRYQRLKFYLAKLKEYKTAKTWQPIAAPKKEISVGMSDPVVLQIRNRLHQLGYLNRTDTDILDNEFLVFLNQWQKENNLPVTSVLTGYGKLPKTPLDGLDPMKELFVSLSVNVDVRINRIIANMEKFRWMPDDFGGDYIFVNLASQYLKVYSGTATVMEMKTMNGTVLKRTPQMRTMMTDVQFNPRWSPTPNIVMEKMKILRKDPEYFNKIRMKVFTGNRVMPVSELLTYSDLQIKQSVGSRINFLQDPGPENALGVLRFNLENDDIIYMHDTNERAKFPTQMNRMLSSGCIRIERPYEMAEYVLRGLGTWPMDAIYAKTAKGIEGEKIDVAFRVNLPKRIPVYLVFQSAEVNEAGHLLFFADSYGQDARILSAINQKGADDEIF